MFSVFSISIVFSLLLGSKISKVFQSLCESWLTFIVFSYLVINFFS